MRTVRHIVFLVASVGCIASAQVAGNLRILELHSRIFGNTRHIRVLLPAAYDAPENRSRRYPVLYLNDGQNLFDTATSVFNRMEWKVDESVAGLTAGGDIEPMIVVGIDSVGRRGRATEYLPFADEYLHPSEPNVRGRDYPRFVVEEVMPLVNANFRTSSALALTGIGGSSYGAVAALMTAVGYPQRFGLLLLESPSLYVGDGKLLGEMGKVHRWPDRVYIGVGTNEGGRPACEPDNAEPEAVRDVRSLERIIGAHRTALKVVVESCAKHNEDAWSRRFPIALRFLYSGRH